MLENIKQLLDSKGTVDEYQINVLKDTSKELFFIKDKLQMTRGKDVTFITVTVYKNFEIDGKKFKGSSSTKVSPTNTIEEIEGLALFNTEPLSDASGGGGGCFLCHPVPDNSADEASSVFTDFSYDNLGIPTNPLVNELAGPQPKDLGLGSQKAILTKAYEEATGGQKVPRKLLKGQKGKFKVSSLRNIAKTAPYGHNGFFPTLYDIVHFYNTRDAKGFEEFWPAPEVRANVNNVELGDLNLTFAEEQKIVVFLETLTDR